MAFFSIPNQVECHQCGEIGPPIKNNLARGMLAVIFFLGLAFPWERYLHTSLVLSVTIQMIVIMTMAYFFKMAYRCKDCGSTSVKGVSNS